MQDLDGVAIEDQVFAADPLAIELRRRAPHPSAHAGFREIVMDEVRHVDHRCRRVQGERLVVG